MSRSFVIATVVVVAALIGVSGVAYAQEEGVGSARFEIIIDPVGGTFWTEGSEESGESDFTQYHTALSATYNIHPNFGIEGELAGDFGVEQRLSSPNLSQSIGDTKAPGSLAYSGNVVVYPWTSHRALTPFVTGGVGRLTMLDRIAGNGFMVDNHSFFTTNVGGGVKYYWGRVGVRSDYRFLWASSSDDADPFFGRTDDRYGHRVTGGLILKFR